MLIHYVTLYNYIIFSQDVRTNLLSKLLIDFPEFLCEKHSEFIAAMPRRHINMRNIISCAFPPNMHLPDPLTPGLKVEMLPEIQQHLRISPIFLRMIESMPFKQVRYFHS
jgi:hypothetical protein